MRFSVFKTEVYFSYTLLCLGAISVILGVFQGFLACAAAVLIHESGHLITMTALGYPPESIKISLFEIAIIDAFRHSRTAKENFFIIFFGPFANFICFIAFYLLYLLGNEFMLPYAAANLSVGLFNSLPVLSLDGGQLIYLLLCKKHEAAAAERTVNILTFIIIFPLAALGFIILFHSRYNFSLLFVCAYLMVALIGRRGRYY